MISICGTICIPSIGLFPMGGFYFSFLQKLSQRDDGFCHSFDKLCINLVSLPSVVNPIELLIDLNNLQPYWQPHNRAIARRIQNMGWRADGGLWLLVRGGGLYLSKGNGVRANILIDFLLCSHNISLLNTVLDILVGVQKRN